MLKKVQIFKALDIEIKKQKGPAVAKDSYRGHHSLKEELSQSGITVIGEVAGGNPLRGQVRDTYRAATHAKSLLENGARAISVATDRFLYFGEDKHLSDVRGAVKVPLLRRDFIFEEYQVEESKILGADAIFLVAALLEPDRLKALLKLAAAKSLDVVVEVFGEADLKRALEAEAEIVCVVGRDMDTWEPSYERALALLKKVPAKKCLRMVEAGISTLPCIKELEGLGVHGVIVGDVLLDEFYPGKRLAQILAGIEPTKKPAKPKAKADAKPAAATPKPSTPPQASTAKPAHQPSTSHPARKGKKEFQMEHIQTPDETTAQAPVAEAPAAKKPAKKAAAKKPAVKKAAAKKPAAKKPAVKKAAPKKAAAKKPAVKKAAPKKAAAKKPVVKKAVKKVAPKKAVKKVAPKKAVKKAVAKKPAVKKAAPKKVVKKAVAKKPAAKKAPAKKAVKK